VRSCAQHSAWLPVRPGAEQDGGVDAEKDFECRGPECSRQHDDLRVRESVPRGSQHAHSGGDRAALTGFVLPPLVRQRNRNTPLLAVLTALWTTNIAFYWGLSRGNPGLARHALFIGVDIVLLLITVIGGRLVPAFTASALKQRGITSVVHAWRDMTPLAIGARVGSPSLICFGPKAPQRAPSRWPPP